MPEDDQAGARQVGDEASFTDNEMLDHPDFQRLRAGLTQWARKPKRGELPWLGSDSAVGESILHIMVFRPSLWCLVDGDGKARCRECYAAQTYGSMIACLADFTGSSWTRCPSCDADNFNPDTKLRDFVEAA